MGARPTKPSDPRIQGIRLQHPTDSTKVIQLELEDTGLLTSDNVERWRLSVGSGSGPIASLPSVIPDNPPIALTGSAQQLPDVDLVNSIRLKADPDNTDSIWLGKDNSVAVDNGYELEPGESVTLIATNLNLFWMFGTALDELQRIGG